MKIFLWIILLLITFFNDINAQVLKIINKTDLQPVENVYIYSTDKKRTSLSNNKGEADISMFNDNDTLIFQHQAYQDISISYIRIKKKSFLIKLNESSIIFDDIIISASKWEQKKSEVPNKIKVITSKEISFNNPQTSADLLNTSNEVFVQKSQMGGGSPMIRGFSANSVLLVIDGVRMNNAIYRSGNLQNVISLDANIIDGTEIIFGPGSVIYGSDALGGVMDFHTKKPLLSTRKTIDISTNALTRYSTANNEKTGHLDLNISTNKIGLLSSFTYSDYGDLRMGSNKYDEYQRLEYIEHINGKDSIISNENPDIQKFSGYDQLNIMQKLLFSPNKNIEFTYAFHYSKISDVPRYDRLIVYQDNDTLKYSEWYYGPQKWSMHSLQANYSDTTLLFDDIKFITAYQDYEESRHSRKFESSLIKEQFEAVDIITVNLDLDKKISKNNYLFYGIEGVNNIIMSTAHKRGKYSGETSATGTRYPDGDNTYYSFAGYLNYKNNMSEKFTFISGLRYSHIFLNSTIKDTSLYHLPFDKIEVNTGAVNGCIGIVIRPDEKLQFNINASSGFRAPNLDDAGKIFDPEPGNVVVPNENLKPEFAYNIDFGGIKNFSDKAKLDITLFYTILDNAMVRRDFLFNGQDSIMYDGELSKVEAVVNAESAYIYGGNVSFYSDITNRFSFNSYLSYTIGKDNDGIPLRHVAPLFGSTHIVYKRDKFKTDLYANYNGSVKNEKLAPSEQEKPHIYATDSNGYPFSPAWFTINLKAAYHVNSFIQVNGGIENILDHRYRPYSSGICAAGRNFFIAIRATI